MIIKHPHDSACPPLKSFEDVERENDAWLQSLSLLGTTSANELLSPALTAEGRLCRLCWEGGVRGFDYHTLSAKCRCSEARIKEMLKTFSSADPQAMIENEKIKVTCEFCSQEYTFDPEAVGLVSPVD